MGGVNDNMPAGSGIGTQVHAQSEDLTSRHTFAAAVFAGQSFEPVAPSDEQVHDPVMYCSRERVGLIRVERVGHYPLRCEVGMQRCEVTGANSAQEVCDVCLKCNVCVM